MSTHHVITFISYTFINKVAHLSVNWWQHWKILTQQVMLLRW